MYEAHWGLQEKPFENTPDPKYFFATPQHREACARLLYCVRERKGAGLLTGVFGCGKTVVAHLIRKELPPDRYRTVYLGNPRLEEVDLLRVTAHYLGLWEPPPRKADLLLALETLLREHAGKGRDVVLMVDEAHTMAPPLFEELRLLLNYQEPRRFLLTLILMGQPELAALVNDNKPLEQRIGIKAWLDRLQFDAMQDYVRHRLTIAGHPAPSEVFTREALHEIYEATGGIPRRINRLCDMCLLSGFASRAARIDAGVVAQEVRDLAGTAATT